MGTNPKIKQFLTFLSNNSKEQDTETLYNFEKGIIKYLDFLCYLEKEVGKGKAYRKFLQNKLNAMGDTIMEKAYLLEKSIAVPSARKQARNIFRDIFGKYFFQSRIMKHAYEKPQGYPGDYLLSEMVYENRPLSKGVGYYFDKNFLNNSLNTGVRSRKDKMKYFLKKYIDGIKSGPVEIMNIGCGSCREIKEWIEEHKAKEEIIFTCIDWDKVALKFAKDVFKSVPENIKINLLQKDTLNIIKENVNMQKEGKKDLIYSLGLSNYLGPNLLDNFLKFYYTLLKPDGRLILSFWNSAEPVWYEHPKWYCEWHFSAHNPYSLKSSIAEGLKIRADFVKIIRNPSEPIFFMIIKKSE